MVSFIRKIIDKNIMNCQRLKLNKNELLVFCLFGILFIFFQFYPMYIIRTHKNLPLDVFLFAVPLAIFGLYLIFTVLFNMTHKWSWIFMYVGCFIFLLSFLLFPVCCYIKPQ